MGEHAHEGIGPEGDLSPVPDTIAAILQQHGADKPIRHPDEVAELVKQLKKIMVPHERFREGILRLRLIHAELDRSPAAEAGVMTFLGRSGSGKSNTLRYYARQYPPRKGESGWIRPVVYVRVPPEANKAALLRSILSEMGLPVTNSRDTDILMRDVLHHLREQKVELLILDEMQHLIDQRTQRFQYISADILKDLLSSNCCQMVFAGLDSAIMALEVNPQLNRRSPLRFPMTEYDWFDEEDQASYVDFLTAVADQMPFQRRPALDDVDVAERLHRSSDGLIGITMNLVAKGMAYALSEDAVTVTLDHLAAGFDELKRRGIKINPFRGKCPESLGVPVDYIYEEDSGLSKRRERPARASFSK
jgi:hypothetical protein